MGISSMGEGLGLIRREIQYITKNFYKTVAFGNIFNSGFKFPVVLALRKDIRTDVTLTLLFLASI